MTATILRLYDYMKAHRMLCVLSFVVVTLLLVVSVLRLSYKEDISDFLPVDSQHHNALKIYQDISGANKIFAVFQYRDTTKTDPEMMVTSVDAFVETIQRTDTAHRVANVMSQIDLEKLSAVTDLRRKTMQGWTVCLKRRITSIDNCNKISRCCSSLQGDCFLITYNVTR